MEIRFIGTPEQVTNLINVLVEQKLIPATDKLGIVMETHEEPVPVVQPQVYRNKG